MKTPIESATAAPVTPVTPAAAAATDALFETALARLRRRATGSVGAAAGGAALLGTLQLPLATGCAVEPGTGIGEIEQDSWSQDEGQRNTQMVSYLRSYWVECRQPNTRFGCGSYQIFVKVRVRPVANVDLAWKKVGLTYRLPHDQSDHTAVGYYFSTMSNGDEEWHVPVTVYSSSTVMTFDVWYQDGAYHTFYDDNQGELHVLNTGGDFNVLRVEPWLNTVQLTDAGVKGKVSVQLADLDYDKQVVLVGTTDDWNTVFELGMGAPGDANKLYWVEDFPWSGFERWQIDLDLPCDGSTPMERFQYAIAYRHGVVNGAQVYEFWDNNYGQNYVVERQEPVE